MNNANLQLPVMTDDELVDGYLDADISCFDELLRRYGTRLFNYIYRFIGHRQEAEDIFQDVFDRVIGNIGRYRKRGRFSAWIFKIACNGCRDHIRRRKKTAAVSLDQEVSTGDGHSTLEDFIPADVPLPSGETQDRDMEKVLREAVAGLPEKLKEVLVMRIYGEIPFKEISRILRCPLNTALARMQYALEYLRKKLATSGVGDELR